MLQKIRKVLVSEYALFVLLICAVIAATLGLYRLEAARHAPALAGYAWQDHPKTLLLAYTNDCGCGPSPEAWVQIGLQKRLDVLLVSSRPQPTWAGILARNPSAHLQTRDSISPSTFRQLSPTGNLACLLIEDGNIKRRGSAVDTQNLFAE